MDKDSSHSYPKFTNPLIHRTNCVVASEDRVAVEWPKMRTALVTDSFYNRCYALEAICEQTSEMDSNNSRMTSPNKNKLSPMDECERAFKRTLAQMPVPSWYANSVKNSRHSGGSDTHLHRRRSLESDSRIIKSTSMDEPAAGSNTEIPQPKWKSGTIGNPLAMRTPAVRRRVNNAGDIHWPDRKVTYLPMPGTECSLRSRPSLSSISGTANGTKAGYIPGSNNTVAQMSRWYKPKNLAVMAMKAKQAIPTDKHDSRRLKCSEPFSVPTENGTETCARSDGSNLPPYHTSGSLDGDNEVREIMGATAYTDDLTSETRSNKGNGILTFEPQKMPTIEHCVNAVQGHTTRPESTLPPSKFGTSSPPGQHTSTDDSYSFHTCLMGDQSSSSMYMSARETESGAESIARPLKTTNSKGTMNERLSRASESTLLPLDDSVDVNTSTASSQRDRKPTGLYDNLVSTTSKFGIRKYCGRINRTATREGDGQETQSGKQSSTRYCKTKDTSIQCKLQKTSTCPAVDYNRGDELLLATGIKQTPSSDIAILKQLVARIDQTFTKHDQALKAYTLSSAVSTEDGQIIDINCVPTNKQRLNAGLEEFNDIVKKILQFPSVQRSITTTNTSSTTPPDEKNKQCLPSQHSRSSFYSSKSNHRHHHHW